MKRFASKTPSALDNQQTPVASPPPGQSLSAHALDVDQLLSKTGTILAREVQNLLIKSSGGKLDAPDSRDLVAYIRLLSELKTEQQKALANLTPEELEALYAQNTSDQL